MDDQKIVINGKEVDISKMSDDELVEFFTELKERELKLIFTNSNIKFLSFLNKSSA